MSTSVLAKEFERLATRNAQLLHTDEGEGKTLGQSAELEAEFDANLTRLTEIKALMEKADEFEAVQAWAATPQRAAAAFAPEAPERARSERTGGPANPGRDLVANAAFQAYLKNIAPNGKLSDNSDVASAKFQVQNLVTGGSATSGGAFFETDYTGLYVPYVQAGLTLRDLVLNLRTEADVVQFVRATTHTNAAAETAEATTAADAVITYDDPDIVIDTTGMGLKPEGEFAWEQVTRTVVPIAEMVPISKRTLLNAPMVEDIINNQLRYDIEARINTQMAVGNGTDPNLRGIRNTSGILTQAFSNNVIETLRKAKTKVANPATGSGKIPNGAVLTPTAMETLDLFRVGGSTTTDGPFLINPFGDAPRRLWGMNLVEEPGMTTSKAVVGFFRDAVLWDREQTTIEVFTQHKDHAQRNIVDLLAEWWGTFGVLQPKSFCDATTA